MFNIVTVRFCLTHSFDCNFRNTMPRRKPISAIRQPSNSGSGADGRLEFILRVGGREPDRSVERLGVPAPSCSTGVAWTENILFPDSRWGDGRDCKTWDYATRSRPRFRAWVAGLMKSGFNFRSEIPLVVSLSEIPLVVALWITSIHNQIFGIV